MIDPPRPGQPYPGRLPPLRRQWTQVPLGARVAAVAGPVVALAAVFAVSRPAGAAIGVMVAGAALCTVVFVKNRTDRHNAAVDRGEIRVPPDPGFRPVERDRIPTALADRLAAAGFGVGAGPSAVTDSRRGAGSDPGIGRIVRFDGGWIVGRTNPRDVAVVIGDDGGWARFDPKVVTDLWAVAEYGAGRGREGG